jgi:hypothetical protein
MTTLIPEPETDIAEYFRRDPLLLTQSNISAMIAKYRSMRHLFNSGTISAGKLVTKKAPAVKADIADLLGELDLNKLLGDK